MMDHMKKWEEILREMLFNFRRRCPDDTSTDRELLESVSEYFVSSGLFGKNIDGKFILPTITENDLEQVLDKLKEDLM
jgi:hypothetical protein